MGDTRMPRSITGMNSWQAIAIPYFLSGEPTKASLYGFKEEETAEISAKFQEWNTAFTPYADKENGRTHGVITRLNQLIREIVDMDQNLRFLNRIAASTEATDVDLEIFNISPAVRSSEGHGSVVTRIKTNVVPVIRSANGGIFDIRCKNDADSRTHILKEADCVEYRYCLGDTAPTSSEDERLKDFISKRASFTLNVGGEHKGENLYLYLRWQNMSHTEIAGAWTQVQECIVI